jgi:hypothetical protein
MSKFTPNKEKKEDQYAGQAKPKLKIKINFKDGETTINEYDLAQMVSNMNIQLMQLSQAVKGITDAMQQISQAQGNSTAQPTIENSSETVTLNMPKIPKLNKVEDNSVNLQS